MPQDQLFKELIQEFFREFLELFYPDVAARLDFDRVLFLDKEAFTDVPEGSRREADIVAQVHRRDGRVDIILIHVEVQTQRRRDFPFRMFEYYALLRLRHKHPVLPIAVYLSPGSKGLVQETYTEELFESEQLRFTYRAIGLPDLNSADYESQENPLGPALSALMRPGGVGQAMRKAMILRRRAIIDANEARRTLLINIVERYIPLDPTQQAEFQQLVRLPGFTEVETMITPYEERGIKIGIEQGIEQGIERGIEQGLIEGTRRALLRQLQARFDTVPEIAKQRIQSITAQTELDALLDRVLTAPSLEDMGLN